MLQAGKMNEIADELIKYKIQVTALQDVRWTESGWIRKKNYSSMCSGHKIVKRPQRHRIPDYWKRRPECTWI
jgi:hypothetical protein